MKKHSSLHVHRLKLKISDYIMLIVAMLSLIFIMIVQNIQIKLMFFQHMERKQTLFAQMN